MAGPAELVRDFVNTYDLDRDTDELSSPAELALWLRERGLAGAGDRAGEEELAIALALREGLRAALSRLPYELPVLPLKVAAGDTPVLVPIEEGVRGGLAMISAAVVAARADGGWERLKVCGEVGCQWAFVDSSKNRSRSWCSMRVCGNRAKTRAYRARRQVASGSRHRQGSITDTV